MKEAPTQQWLWALSVLNVVALLLVWAVERFIGERYWLAMLLTYAPQHPLGIPAALLLLWAILSRDSWAVAANILSLLLFAFSLLGFQVPRPALALASARDGTVRVMTYNIHHAPQGARTIVWVVERNRADIVCTQETDISYPDPDPMPALKQLLHDWHVYHVGELAIFSRFPFSDCRAVPMPGGPRRVFLVATVSVHGQPLTVFNVHLNTAARPRSLLRRQGASVAEYLRESAHVRAQQVERVLETAEGITGPRVIAGDFNTPPRGRLYHRLAARFTDAFARAGWGLGHTFRTDLPILRIDYVWTSPDVRAIQCWVPRADASDHRPVVADLVIQRRE